MNMSNGILDDVSYEMISKAKSLAINSKNIKSDEQEPQVEAICLGCDINKESVKKAFKSGADRFVFVKNDSLGFFNSRVFAQSFVEYFKQNESEVIIFPATRTGRMVAPRITTLLDTGLVADCTELDFVLKDTVLKLAPTRPTFGSELMATILSKKNPQCATIRPKTFEPCFSYNEDGQYFEYNPTEIEENQVKLIRSLVDKNVSKFDFSDSRIIFAAGYGLAQGRETEYFDKLEQLAKYFGAKVASTRKVVDFGLMQPKTQIGQTGSTVNADVYVAFGVSGAIQHIMGMKNSKVIISINKDENAEIFKYSDYKIVADAKKVIDEMIDNYLK